MSSTTTTTPTTTPSEKKKEPQSFREVLQKASASAVRGGTAGAVAMGANVAALMWMRTTINYQYRNGTSFPVALRTLYADGGIPRFYRGVLPALIQGPLSRFGDTAANTGMLTLMDNMELTADLNVGFKTMAASGAAAAFRIVLMPIDTVKVREKERVGVRILPVVEFTFFVLVVCCSWFNVWFPFLSMSDTKHSIVVFIVATQGIVRILHQALSQAPPLVRSLLHSVGSVVVVSLC
jgi:hypothetical protein